MYGFRTTPHLHLARSAPAQGVAQAGIALFDTGANSPESCIWVCLPLGSGVPAASWSTAGDSLPLESPPLSAPPFSDRGEMPPSYKQTSTPNWSKQLDRITRSRKRNEVNAAVANYRRGWADPHCHDTSLHQSLLLSNHHSEMWGYAFPEKRRLREGYCNIRKSSIKCLSLNCSWWTAQK